jgi:hypothetical protein
MLTWSSAFVCLAQDARLAVRSEPTSSRRSYALQGVQPGPRAPYQPWLWAAAGTTAAFAAGLAMSEGFSYKATSDRAAALERSRDIRLELSSRLQAADQASDAKQRADLLDRVSNVCLAGSIAATGTMLLIWLTGKERKKYEQNKYLLGPMVLREWAGAGLVLREKF